MSKRSNQKTTTTTTTVDSAAEKAVLRMRRGKAVGDDVAVGTCTGSCG